MTLRITFFYGHGPYGWSETWWRADSSFGPAVPAINDYIAARMGTQPANVSCNGIRISTEGASRFSQTFQPGQYAVPGSAKKLLIPNAGTYVPAIATTRFDQTRVALQLEYKVGAVRLGLRYFALVPDPVTLTETATLDQVNPADWWKAFNKWADLTISAGWQIRTTSPNVLGLEKDIKAWELSAGAGTNLAFSISADSTLAITLPAKVRVRGTRMKYSGLRSPNGVWQVVSVTGGGAAGDQVVTIADSSTIDNRYISTLGKAYVIKLNYINPTDYIPYRAGIHKRGSPFPRTRGRVPIRRFAP